MQGRGRLRIHRHVKRGLVVICARKLQWTDYPCPVLTVAADPVTLSMTICFSWNTSMTNVWHIFSLLISLHLNFPDDIVFSYMITYSYLST
uniref:Uncharacterized protein n=1 Tax=Arundo donax TaxID=35708 RepID=A0A0A9E811_ARUDO